MLASTHGHDSVDAAARIDPRPFLSSHRALAVRARAFERLAAAAVSGVSGLHALAAEPGEKPVVRRSPDRCLVQFGPVALTLAWLRHTIDSVAEGELLVIVWRGMIAPNGRFGNDSTTTACTPVRSATVLWEEAFRASATDEASWTWRPASMDIGGYDSAELADRCVERLRLAYAEGADDVDAALAPVAMLPTFR
jgi:hypothetical protein